MLGNTRCMSSRASTGDRKYFKNAFRNEEHQFGQNDSTRHIADIFDSPAVHVAEFILMYSEPYFKCKEDLICRYLYRWRGEVDWKSLT